MAFWTQWTAKAKGATWSRICKLTNTDSNSATGVLFLLSVSHTRSNVVYSNLFSITDNMYHASNIVLLSSSNYTTSSSIQLRTVRETSTGSDVYVEIYDNNASVTNETEININCSIQTFKSGSFTPYTTYTAGEVPSGALSGSITVDASLNYNLIAPKIKGDLYGNATTATTASDSDKIDGRHFDEDMPYNILTTTYTGYKSNIIFYLSISVSLYWQKLKIQVIGRSNINVGTVIIKQYRSQLLEIDSDCLYLGFRMYYDSNRLNIILSVMQTVVPNGTIRTALQYCECLVKCYNSDNGLSAYITKNQTYSNSNNYSFVDIGTGKKHLFIGDIQASSFIKTGGTSSLFLKADGSVDSTTYATKALLDNLALNSGTGTVTSVATGVGLIGGTITATGTIKASLKSETASSLTATAMGSTANRQYAVGIDANGHLSVNIPWIDNSNLLDEYVTISGDESITGTKTFNKPIVINTGSTNNSYNEGLRITRAGNNWAGITFGSTGASGAPTGGWFAATNPSNLFIINPDDSGSTNGLCLNKNGDAKWRNNTILHYGNYTSYVYSQSLSDDRYVNITGDTMTGGLTFDQTSSSRDVGIIGKYDPLKAAAIWSMGSSYLIKNDGTTLGSLYGAAYVYFGKGYTFGEGYSGGHSFVWALNGTINVALGNFVWSRGGFIKNSSSDSYVLLGGGGHKAVSDFATTTALSGYLPLTGGTLTGNLYLNSGANLVTNSTGNYANGIRINRVSTSNWASMTIGYVSSNTSSGASGSDSHTWMIATPAGSDYLNISNNGNTSTSTGLTLKGRGNNDIVWNNNVIVHSGNISSYAITSHQSLSNYLPLSGGTMTGNIIIGSNSIIYNKVTTSSWNLGSNSGLQILNTVGASATGAPSLYSVGLHVSGYYGFLLSCNGADNVFTIRSMSNGIETPKSWVTLIHSGNISSQSVAYATNATTATQASYVISPYKYTGHNTYNIEGESIDDSATSDVLKRHFNGTLYPVFHRTDWGWSDTLYWSSYDKYGGTLLATEYNAISNVRIKIRKYNLSRSGWGDWTEIITSGNISSYGYITGITKQMVIDALGYTPPTTNSTYNFSGTTFYSGNSSNAEHNANNAIKNGNYYYSSNGPATTLGASTGDGALYVLSHSDSWVGQIALDYRNGRLFVRGKNNGTWQSWRVILDSNNISSYALTGWRTADALGAGGAPITTSVSSTRITDSYYVLATTSSGSCAWYKLPSNAFLNDNTNTTYSAGTGLSLDGTTFNAKLATNALLGVTKYVKYYSAASVKRYNGDVGGSEVDTSTTSNIELAYASSTSGRFYPVLVDKNGFPFVNIPWSDTTYTFTTSGSGNVLTGVSTSGTTITFTKGNVSSGSTYSVVSNSENGLAPKVISTNAASVGSAYYVLASTNGSASPSWYKLPSTAFRDILINGTSISNNTLNIKSGGGISVGKSNGTATISLYISVNGSTADDSTSIYAPTTAGTSGYILLSNGSGAPGWTSFTSISSIVKIQSSVPSSFNSNTLYVITG